jgi:hypothetical protein
MDDTGQISKQEYRHERSLRGRAALFISLLSLAFAGWSLFETALRQPAFNVYAGPFWQYGRGSGLDDEVLTVPLTFANNGARPGAIVSLTLTVEQKGGTSREFVASAVAQSEKDRALFAPISVAGRSAYTASIIFTPKETAASAKAIVAAEGSYTARLTVCTAYNQSFGVFDTYLTFPPPDILASLSLQHFDIGQLLDKQSETLTAKTSNGARASGSACDGHSGS